VPATWADLPGWSDDDVAAAWPAFLLSCRGVASRANGNGWKRVCDLARAADGKPGFDARRFFEQNLTPYAIANGDGAVNGWSPAITSPAARQPAAGQRLEQPVRGVPDDLLTIDLSAVFPELKDKRVRGRLEGNKVLPYWSRAEITAKGDKLPGKTLLYVDDAVELFFLRCRAPAGSAWPTAARCA
jgi:membrane-bound lytic murein transglycosylase A